ncbi:MAG: Crp/Fnr family transcriptional regulator [Bacteroides sp.]|nr:Crp/Fnr family transcriptional regulator [Bacteroides sp.]
MEIMIKKFTQKYQLPEKDLLAFLAHMTEVHFTKGELILKEGERNTNFYLIKKGIWRAYYLTDGTDNSLWFVSPGDVAFSSWGYIDDKPSLINIESVNESIAYCIDKASAEELFSGSMEMANFSRKIFEREILAVDNATLVYSTPSTAEGRYLTLMEENPELLQGVPLKYLASYLYITPQSLSRIRAGLRRKK